MIEFSVVIAVYNKEQYLATCLDSVLNQTHSTFELIVVNDGSTDGSKTLLASYAKDERLQIINQTNQGASTARNKGIAKASKNYIALLDADDYWLPFHLEQLAEAIKTYPEQAVFATNSNLIINGNKRQRTYSVAIENKVQVVDFFKASYIDSIINSSTAVIKREVFNNVGDFNLQLINSEDTDLWIRIGAKYKIVFIAKVSACIVSTPQGLSKQHVPLNSKLDFSAYKALEATNSGAKKFCDLNRFSFAILEKQQGNLSGFKDLLSQIDKENLNTKQRFLLKQTPSVIKILLRFKAWTNKMGLGLSAYK